MSKLKLAIYYIGDESELVTAGKLRENVAQRAGKKTELVPLFKFGTKGQEVPDELILLAHSDDTQTTIGGKTPKILAQELASQFQAKDHTQLKSIKLLSCEGGYGKHPLALELAKELDKQGFKQAVVKAATHPEESKIGGVVSVTTQAGISRMFGNEVGKVTAVMHGNQKTADYIRWKDLDRMRGRGKIAPNGWTEALGKEMQGLAKKHNDFAGFDAKHPDYCVIKLAGDINDLDAPYNCYTKDGVQAKLSLVAAIYLETLRAKRYAFEKIQNKNVIAFIDNVIKKIYENPAMDQPQILQILSDKQLTKNVSKEIVSDIKKCLDVAIERKLNAMNPSKLPGKVETIASELEKKKDYYDRLLAKDGLFDKMWRSIYGTIGFAQGLRKLLIVVSHKVLLAKTTREDIIGRIEAQKAEDVELLAVTEYKFEPGNFFGKGKVMQSEKKNTPLGNLYQALDVYCAKPNPKAEDWRSVDKEYRNYKQNSKENNIQKLEGLIKELEANNKKFNKIETKLDAVKNQVKTAIQAYLVKFDKDADTDNRHKPKVAVMKAIQTYVNAPNADNWAVIERTRQLNPGWDKGMFSKVRFMMFEARKVHEEQEQCEQNISSGLKKVM